MEEPASPAARPLWRDRLTSPWAAGLVLALFYVALVLGAREKSPTLDEPGHATAGYTYWKYNDYRLDPENGNLPQRIIGLPLALGGFRFPERSAPEWLRGEIYALADRWFYDLGNDTESLVARGRAAIAGVTAGLGALIWWWSRRMFGPAAGLLSLLAFALNPTVLANGALMTSDLACAAFFLLALFCLWRLLREPTLPRLALSAAAAGALAVTKHSAVLFLPVALLLAVARLQDGEPIAFPGFRPAVTRAQRGLALGALGFVHAVAVLAIIWACYGFRFNVASPANPARAELPWDDILAVPAPAVAPAAGQAAAVRPLPLRLAAFALQHRLLPEAYVCGYVLLWRSTGTRIGFLNGEVKVNSGWRRFFPYTILVKTPLAFLAVLSLAAVAAVGASRRVSPKGCAWLRSDTLPLLGFATVYLAAAIASNLNIGHRHILPIYPPLFVLAGAAVAGGAGARGRGRTRAAWLLMLPLAVETACWFPNYLAYFNGIVRPSQAYRHLVDSSLDWGQDLPALRRYLDTRRPAQPLYLAQFGLGPRPDHYGIAAAPLAAGMPPVLVILGGVSYQADREAIEGFLRRNPDFDGRFVAAWDSDGRHNSIVVRRAGVLKLDAGTYFISATALQPLVARAAGPWQAAYESDYQKLKRELSPLFSDDLNTRLQSLGTKNPNAWVAQFDEFATLRFARLTAFLRKREPDDQINHTILVYRLTTDDIARALEGPPP